jgi:hypothetical protein
MINGDESVIQYDFSQLGIELSSKPIIHGGLAMEYYGLRKRGQDIDFIISNPDYQVLEKKYPNNKKDMWGDLGLSIGEFELFRSVCRLDYDFFSKDAIEYDTFKVLSFEKLFFMKALAYYHQPELKKHTDDFELVVNDTYDRFQNKDYVESSKKHLQSYLSAPNGTIFNDNY